jgi:probable addiction module antidote protein
VSVELAPYDPADLLRTDEDIRAYLTDALNDDNPSVFVIALGDVVRIQGIGNVAENSGLDIQRLHAALSTHGNLQWETIHRILKSLDIHLQAAA